MLTHLKQGILAVDSKANVVFYNEPVTHIAGIDPQEAIGKNILEIFPGLTPETSTFYNVLRTKKPIIDYVQNYTNYRGEHVCTITSTMPLLQNGNIVGAFELYRELATAKELTDKIISLQKELFKASNEKNHESNRAQYTFDDIIGESSAMRELIEKAKRVADSDSPILVYGETGTGKELLVQAIHNYSIKRRDKPFVAQNCAALPKTLLEGILFGTSAGSFTGAKDKPGLFEIAHGGTLFLDEINSMDMELQAKLLRVLQDGIIRRIGATKTMAVDVRIITSTNEDPIKAIKKKLLREDLFYRLNVVSLKIPPLRERKGDIPVLVEFFIDHFNKRFNKNIKMVSQDVMDIFADYNWPGNVRELKSTVESIMNFIEGDMINLKDLPSKTYDSFLAPSEGKTKPNNNNYLPTLNDAVSNFEKNLIAKAIGAADGNYAQAARLLKVPRQTLHNKIKKYKLDTKG